jgi:hypothetical protein
MSETEGASGERPRKHAVVACHPEVESFTLSVAKASLETRIPTRLVPVALPLAGGPFEALRPRRGAVSGVRERRPAQASRRSA